MKSCLAREKEVERKWYVIDAKGKVPGRFASEVAGILRGEKRPIYTPNIDTGDYIIVISADKVRLTGEEWDQKQHVYRAGYPRGCCEVSYKELLGKHPEHVMEYAIKGMMPKNSLSRRMFRKLKVYAGSEHLHEAQSPEAHEF